MNRFDRLSRMLLDLRRGGAESLIVAVSVSLSLLFTTVTLAVLAQGPETWLPSFAIATAVPLLVATPVSIGLMGLLRRLDLAHEEARRLACTDPLTGLFNRRHWIELAEREISRADFDGSSVCVLMVDVDNFKVINDTHGHCTGDQVLMAVARSCRESLRPNDVVARWGGEEFLVLLSATNAREGAEIAERLREHVARTAALGQLAPAAEVTVSIGVADTTSCAAGHDLQRLLAAVDRALYAAKGQGRDRVRQATSSDRPCEPALQLAGQNAS
jgi:diguanylate cyclase